MPPSVTGPVSGGKAGVSFVLRPPLEFINRQVGRFADELEDLDGLWDRFAEVLPDIFQRWFESEGDGSWPPLAESTLARKSELGYPPDTLVATGEMRDHLLDPTTAVERSGDRMVWGTDAPHAVFHQIGSTRLPQREVIPDPFPADERQRLEAAVVDWVNDAAAQMARGRFAA